jgi:hypothetical protein
MHAMAARMDFTSMKEGSVSRLVPGVSVEACELNHPGKTLVFRVEAEGKDDLAQLDSHATTRATHGRDRQRIWGDRH